MVERVILNREAPNDLEEQRGKLNTSINEAEEMFSRLISQVDTLGQFVGHMAAVLKAMQEVMQAHDIAIGCLHKVLTDKGQFTQDEIQSAAEALVKEAKAAAEEARRERKSTLTLPSDKELKAIEQSRIQ